jgi:SAM-dependent methyltransferase
MSALDALNQAAWTASSTRRLLEARAGALDAGEAAAFAWLSREVAGEPILDLGVGAGRTVPLLRAISEDYVGIDYLPELVELAAARFPEARIQRGDARDLSGFDGGEFALVVFSAHGIDGVSHGDRARAFSEVRRVLRPGGLFFYSTHNLSHPMAGRPPWDRRWWPRSKKALVRRLLALPIAVRAYRRGSRLAVRGEAWATLVHPAYGFRVVCHFVTLAEAFRELEAAGFVPLEVYDRAGERLEREAETRHAPTFNLIARRS